MFKIIVIALILSFPREYALQPNCPCDNEDLCKPVQVTYEKEVLGFMISPVNWRNPGYNWSELTTIAIFANMNDSDLHDLVCLAHTHQVRVVTHIGSEILKLSNEDARHEYAVNLLMYVQSHFLDGVNIDAEDPVANNSVQKTILTAAVKEIFTIFKASTLKYQVTFDVAWSPNCIDGRCFDHLALAQNTDFLVIMAYDERSQIFTGPCIAGANSNYIQTQEGVEAFINLGIPTNKLVLGLPWYGYDYQCISVSDNNVCQIKRVPYLGANCSDAAGKEINYSYILSDLLPLTTTGLLYDTTTESLYFTYKNVSVLHQVWFDNPKSLSIKYKYAKRMNLRGLAFWNIDTLDYGETPNAKKQQQEMWEAIEVFLEN